MLSIRLSRVGKKKAPVYRIVVMPKHRDPWANATEILGHYNPRKEPKELVVKADRVKHWISQGAEVTDSVWNLLLAEKIVEGEKRGVSHISKKRKAKLDEKEAEAKAKAEEVKAAEEAAAAEAKAAEEAAKAEAAATPAEETPAEEAPAETPEAAPAEEPAAEEKKEETPAEEAPAADAEEKSAE